MLVDLNRFLKPRLFVMDGVMAMEGNGPRGGKPRQMGVLLASADPVALDASFCRMIGLDPAGILTNAAGLEAGLGSYRAEDIEILGTPSPTSIRPTSTSSERLSLQSPPPSQGEAWASSSAPSYLGR